MVQPGKGILAADESTGTITRRFDALGIASTPETRRTYRDLLLTTPGLADAIAGVILFDETIRQRSDDGTPFPQLLEHQGIMPGIKVDAGAKDLAAAPGEKVTEGLDGLRERLDEYRSLGARFAKWRAVLTIGDHLPTRRCIEANAHALARYAALCQEAGLVPIVEPEVLMDGDHDLQRCSTVTEETQRAVFAALSEQGVVLEAMVFKPNMVIAATNSPDQASVEEVADATLRCLRRTVPASVVGIAFLSGGQSPEAATSHLNAMNSRGAQPWELTFSYGRALQDPSLATWRGDSANVGAAQQALAHRARCNGAARSGTYTAEMEDA